MPDQNEAASPEHTRPDGGAGLEAKKPKQAVQLAPFQLDQEDFDRLVRDLFIAKAPAPRPSIEGLPPFTLGTLSFGKVAAEEEKQALPNYFVKRPEYKAILAGNAWMVLGQKGTGKTAIKVNLQTEGKRELLFVDVSPDEMSWQHIKSFRDCGIAPSQAKKNAWLSIFLRSIGDRIEAHAGRPYPLDVISAMLTECGIQRSSKMSLQEIAVKVHAISAKFGKGEPAPGIDFGAVINAVKGSLRVLDEALRADGIFVRLLVDKLDEHWRGAEQENLALEGLVLAAMFLAEETSNIRVQTFLRTDIWDRLAFHDKDKIADSTVYLGWDEGAFRDLIAERIRYSTRQFFKGKEYYPPGDASALFGWAFVDEVEGVRGPGGKQETMRYLSKIIYHRPRDFIQFCQLALKQRGDADAWIGSQDILRAYPEYSEIRLKNLCEAEAIVTAVGLKKVLYHLRDTRTQVKIRYPKLLEKMGEVHPDKKEIYDGLVRLMLYYGVIGLVGKDDGMGARYYYDDHQVVGREFKSDTTFIFHPSFFKSLDLKNIRGDLE